jgi:hypothetical protein
VWIVVLIMYARRSTRASRPTTSVVTKDRGSRRSGASNHGGMTGSSGGYGTNKRGGGGQHYDRIKAAQEKGPVKKWYKVHRSPAPHIRFTVEKWVVESDLLDSERQTRIVKENSSIEDGQRIGDEEENEVEAAAAAAVSAIDVGGYSIERTEQQDDHPPMMIHPTEKQQVWMGDTETQHHDKVVVVVEEEEGQEQPPPILGVEVVEEGTTI